MNGFVYSNFEQPMDTQIFTHPGFIGGMAGCLIGIIGGIVGFTVSYRKAATKRQKSRIVKFAIIIVAFFVLFVGVQILAPATIKLWSWGAYIVFMLFVAYLAKSYLKESKPENESN